MEEGHKEEAPMVTTPHPDKIARLRRKLARKGILLHPSDLQTYFSRLWEVKNSDLLLIEAEKIVNQGYNL